MEKSIARCEINQEILFLLYSMESKFDSVNVYKKIELCPLPA